MGGGELDLLRRDGKITLVFERAPDQRASATLHAMLMGGLVVASSTPPSTQFSAPTPRRQRWRSLFSSACAGFAVWNGAEYCSNRTTPRCSTQPHVPSRWLKADSLAGARAQERGRMAARLRCDLGAAGDGEPIPAADREAAWWTRPEWPGCRL